MNYFRSAALATLIASTTFAISACSPEYEFIPQDPARGPGELAGQLQPLNTTFGGGASPDIQPRQVSGDPDWTECDADCEAYCAAQPFDNPVDEAMCPHLWGAGLDTQPVDDEQACRRIYADMRGAFAVNLERIYDADLLVGKLFRGNLRYDKFIEVVSAHPVLTRRFDNASDRAEALFNIFVGRPPFENERADMAKLYNVWSNGYFDHPELGMRVPDAFVEHKCLTEFGEIDEDTAGACTSVLWGFNRVILQPDYRAMENMTWNENLTPAEWELLQTPGKIVGTWPVVWEHAVEQVLKMYLGYDLAEVTPSVIEHLVEYVLQHQGDIRAAHYAVATSQLYLQSTECHGDDCSGKKDDPRWTYGPFRQAEAELWIDSVGAAVKAPQGACDHRIPSANDLLEDSPIGYEVVAASRWTLDEEGDELRVDDSYSSFAQTLGGCPDNEVAGRFTAISILSTATQEAFVAELCDPGVSGGGVKTSTLLPGGVGAGDALNESVAESILSHQVNKFFSRQPVAAELEMAAEVSTACVPQPCDAEAFARNSCYALLSSSEMLFY
jgi:hypothetical protein